MLRSFLSRFLPRICSSRGSVAMDEGHLVAAACTIALNPPQRGQFAGWIETPAAQEALSTLRAVEPPEFTSPVNWSISAVCHLHDDRNPRRRAGVIFRRRCFSPGVGAWSELNCEPPLPSPRHSHGSRLRVLAEAGLQSIWTDHGRKRRCRVRRRAIDASKRDMTRPAETPSRRTSARSMTTGLDRARSRRPCSRHQTARRSALPAQALQPCARPYASPPPRGTRVEPPKQFMD